MATKGKTANVERRFGRFITELKARYFLGEMKVNWKKCTIDKISPKGVSVEFCEDIQVGSVIHLMITFPREPQTIILKGTLKWIEQRKNVFAGGIEFTEMLDDTTFAKLI